MADKFEEVRTKVEQALKKLEVIVSIRVT
jgi:hypothetical protein